MVNVGRYSIHEASGIRRLTTRRLFCDIILGTSKAVLPGWVWILSTTDFPQQAAKKNTGQRSIKKGLEVHWNGSQMDLSQSIKKRNKTNKQKNTEKHPKIVPWILVVNKFSSSNLLPKNGENVTWQQLPQTSGSKTEERWCWSSCHRSHGDVNFFAGNQVYTPWKLT